MWITHLNIQHKKEGVFVSNELNVTSGEATGTAAEPAAGESTGVTSDNKIVPIANKTGAAESGIATETVVPAAVQPVAAPVVNNSSDGTTKAAAPAAPTAPSVPTAADPALESAAASQATAAFAQTAAGSPVQNQTQEPETPPKHSSAASSYREEREDSFDFDEDERPRRRLFRSRREEESRDKLILFRIKDDELLEYLTLEQRRLEFLQQAKEIREKRLLAAFQLLISLAAIVAVTYLLKDNPTILISILYIVGIIAALIIWKNPRDKGRGRH